MDKQRRRISVLCLSISICGAFSPDYVRSVCKLRLLTSKQALGTGIRRCGCFAYFHRPSANNCYQNKMANVLSLMQALYPSPCGGEFFFWGNGSYTERFLKPLGHDGLNVFFFKRNIEKRHLINNPFDRDTVDGTDG